MLFFIFLLIFILINNFNTKSLILYKCALNFILTNWFLLAFAGLSLCFKLKSKKKAKKSFCCFIKRLHLSSPIYKCIIYLT
jgi:uncharacterized protein YybS (DUF2232 family)